MAVSHVRIISHYDVDLGGIISNRLRFEVNTVRDVKPTP